MKSSTTKLFAQLCNLMPRAILLAIDAELSGKKANAQKFDAWDHLIALVFCHIGQCDSLRKVESLSALTGAALSHAGHAAHMGRSTLSYCNNKRDYRIFERFYYALLKHFEELLKIRLPGNYKRPVFSLDSTTITLCLSLFDWARYRHSKGGFKLHTALNHEVMLPEVIALTDGKVADVKMAKAVIERLPTDSYVVMDRGYNDYELFLWLTTRGTRFVTRLKDGALTTPLREGLRAEKPGKWGDYEFTFTGKHALEICGEQKFRCIQWYDDENERWFEFLTNDFSLSPEEIADLYRDRWKIELFFKKLKQNLKIKGFLGRSPNAVMNQVWAAMITTLLVEVLRRQSTFDWSFSLLFDYLTHSLQSYRDLMDAVNHPYADKAEPSTLKKCVPTVQESLPFEW